MATTKLYWCSFCGKNSEEVASLILGPRGADDRPVAICDECTNACLKIVDRDRTAKAGGAVASPHVAP